jgi:putative transposase
MAQFVQETDPAYEDGGKTMARLPRYFIDGQAHHITQRGNNRTVLFTREEDYVFILSCLKAAADAQGVAVHAYALMRTHMHLLATPAQPSSLPKFMQSVGVRLAQHVNRRRRRTGALFEGRYRDTLIDSERYFVACMRYIENNAPRAGVVRRPEDFPWSSYRTNALGIDNELITPHAIYMSMGRTPGERASRYRALFRRPLSVDVVEVIREATRTAWALGDESFRTWVEARSGRRAGPRFHRRRPSVPPALPRPRQGAESLVRPSRPAGGV